MYHIGYSLRDGGYSSRKIHDKYFAVDSYNASVKSAIYRNKPSGDYVIK